jgi:small subunit ribosomal protein S16
VIEEIGQYHPTEEPSVIKIESERALYWLGVGAQPTEQVAALLKLTGDWAKFKGEKDTESKVKVAEPKQPFTVDASKKAVLKPKSEKTAPAAAPAESADETAETTEA